MKLKRFSGRTRAIPAPNSYGVELAAVQFPRPEPVIQGTAESNTTRVDLAPSLPDVIVGKLDWVLGQKWSVSDEVVVRASTPETFIIHVNKSLEHAWAVESQERIAGYDREG